MIDLPRGDVEVRLNVLMPPTWIAFDVTSLNRKEHAAIRLAGWKAKREGSDPRIARAMAAAETGKVHTIHCGSAAFEALRTAVANARSTPALPEG
jgi:hypothetical protein